MTEKQICKRLGITPRGLKVLAKAVANDTGEAAGAGFGGGAGSARTKLLRDGLIVEADRIYKGRWYKTYVITLGARAKVEAARLLGW